jgi:hypothetical protein
MDKFSKLYNRIIENEHIFVSDINRIYDLSENILYETNSVLPCPVNLVKAVKNIILDLVENNDYSPVKLSLQKVLEDTFIKEQEDSNLVKTLYELFNSHDNAYVNVQIDGSPEFISSLHGRFDLPKVFSEVLRDTDTLHYSYPRIKPLAINHNLDKFVKRYKEDIKFLKTIYDKQQKAIEIFKTNILNFDDFGTITIYPWNCTQNDENIDLPTLDEVIEHECQHLCIFLLSIAKTCIYVGRHFSNNIQSSSLAYPLKESEFITLTGSYCNILTRIFKQIEEPKNINEFVKAVIELSIYGKTQQDKKYVKAITRSQQFPRISQFYKAIYNDSKFGLYDRISNKNLIKFQPNNKFKILIRWTLKNLTNF